MIYLDHASTSWPKAPGVAGAMARAVDDPVGTPGRGSGERAGGIVAGLRRALSVVFASAGPTRVVLTGGCTESLQIAIGSAARRDAGGAKRLIVTTALEHNAVSRTLREHERRGEIEVAVVGLGAGGVIEAADMLARCEPRTVAVVVSGASNVTGAMVDVGAIGRGLRERWGAGKAKPWLVVDAAQSGGLVDHDIDRDGIDLLAVSGHKALRGPSGTGALIVGTLVADDALMPTRFGGTGQTAWADDGPDEDAMPLELPERLEAGTPNVPGLAGWHQAMLELGGSRTQREQLMESRLAHERRLAGIFIEAIRGVDKIRVVSGAARAARPEVFTGVVSVVVDGLTPAEVAGVLEAGVGIGGGAIAVRSGLHCAPWAHRALGTHALGGTVRVSFGATNTEADALACATALKALVGGLGEVGGGA